MPKDAKSKPTPPVDGPNDLSIKQVAAGPKVATNRSPRRESLIPTTHPAAQANPRWWKTRRGKLFLVGGVLLLIIAGSGIAYAITRKKPIVRVETPSPSPSTTPTETPKATKASPLTGVEVTPAQADQPVVASIIENLYPNARPQSGLSSAGVVYEALSEGGITRYLALFQADVPTDIGPVRSLRPVFYDMAMEYGAPVAHAGGSTDGERLANSGKGFKDLDQFYNGSYFRRISSRPAPHNLYIYGPKLVELAGAKGWGAAPTFTPWPRKDDEKSTAPNATTITVNFSGPDYREVFRYSADTDSYLREIAGKPDLDAAVSGKQVNPKTVIVLYAATSSGVQPNGKPKTDIQITGTGKGVIFQDGTATTITWTKAAETSRMKFTDATGNEVKLNRGQSWVSIVPTTLLASWQ